ncbi:NAC domain-containing protein 72-like [Forsythia ovata]|uniref:NAC domain-containing protein 72-like n=1 Tax=Forsythia ovata TaxID=205694 RepID=A0ABD1UVR7_9LAMI
MAEVAATPVMIFFRAATMIETSSSLVSRGDVYKVNGVREMYFFTPIQKIYKNGQRPNRITIDGFWKATGADKTILHNGEAIGCERSLVFYRGIPSRGVKTSWLMHEFKVNNLPPRQPTHEDDMRLDDWVLCKIYNNNEKKSNNNSTKRKREDDIYHQIQETRNQDVAEQEIEPTAHRSSTNVEQEDFWEAMQKLHEC